VTSPDVPGSETAPGQAARAYDQGRVYQARGDQHITEQHHHYHGGPHQGVASKSLFSGADWLPDASGYPSDPSVRWLGPATVRMPLVGTAPPVLRDRRDVMEALRAAVDGVDGGGVHVLHGMGGMGKTAIAHALFQEVSRNGNRIGLWVNAASEIVLRSGMLAVAADRGADSGELAAAHSGQRAAADLVWHYLDHSPEPWLLVVDNLDDPEVLLNEGWLRPSGRGTVVVTSRLANARIWPGAIRHLIDPLPLQDAAQVLHDLAPDSGTLEEAGLVAERLGRLPLALNLAGSYLAHQLLESWTLNEYRERLRLGVTTLVDRGANARLANAGGRHLLGSTWQLSLDTLARQGLPEASTLLRLLSCFGSDPLPLSVLAPAASTVSPIADDRIEPALRGLLDHSLASLSMVPGNAPGSSVRCLQIHGVLLDSVAESAPKDEYRVLLEAATRLLGATFPVDMAPNTLAERLRLLAPHVVALLRRAQSTGSVPGVLSLALQVVAGVHEGGDYRTALAMANEVARVAAQVSRPDHPDTLTALYWVGSSLFRLGRFQESEDLHRRVLADRERTLGPDHADTFASLVALHAPLTAQGRATEAVPLLQRAARGLETELGAGHKATLASRVALVEILAAAGDFPSLDALGPTVVADCELHLGPEHPVTVDARHNWAYGLFHMKRWQAAEVAAKLALELRLRVFGPDHATTLSARVLLGWIWHGQSRYEDAIVQAAEVVEESVRILGAEHPYTLEDRQQLARFLADAGHADESRETARLNLPDCERILGVDHPVTTGSRLLADGE
jgi:tetratricopeptide (TPR) repeat protein